MSLLTFTGTEAPSSYPPDLHPAYWRFPEGESIYTGIIQDIREERAYQGKQGTNLVIEIVNGPYHGRINLNLGRWSKRTHFCRPKVGHL